MKKLKIYYRIWKDGWKPCKIATKNPNSYPTTRHGKKLHVIALEEALGRELRPGYFACHHCDVPGCIEVEHLFEGTRSDNMKDAADKHRLYTWGDYHARKTHCPQGHEYTIENTGLSGLKRYCKTCRRERKRNAV